MTDPTETVASDVAELRELSRRAKAVDDHMSSALLTRAAGGGVIDPPPQHIRHVINLAV